MEKLIANETNMDVQKVGETLTSNRDNIVLVGMMGTGKSTIGSLLASELGYQLVDLDSVIVEEAGCSIPELFEEKGEAYFRDLETTVLRKVLQEYNIVLATGGGAVLRDENCGLMKNNGWVVALSATVDDIISRVGEDPNRPLLAGGARERVTALLEERKHAYSFADVTIATSGKSTEQVSSEILIHYRG
ncbi:shikimate kinase [Fontibacillus solani]|uniref:Shikimate kinase n=2 Tax=Fontibacillus solani TaxID=1572857 RepID=A0A7W3XSY6_9BACL|nr:shikimate kinase [Fontibacillus solani]